MLLLLLLLALVPLASCILYPHESPTRQAKVLDGLWRLRLSPRDDPDVGFRELWAGERWEAGEAMDMPVPASYNDITTNTSVRDFLGWAWYQRTLQLTRAWEGRRLVLRFGSVHHTARVFLNGQEVGGHQGGHMAFEMVVTEAAILPGVNLLTVAVNNTLTEVTVPQGEWVWRNESEMYPPGYATLETGFDFFNYAGIHRSVVLYSTSTEAFITDISTSTVVSSDLSLATFTAGVEWEGEAGCSMCLSLVGREECSPCGEEVEVASPRLWWPRGAQGRTIGELYTLTVSLEREGTTLDTYILPVGLRQVTWDSTGLLVNHQQVYLRGIARHEDSAIRGKGFDLPTLVRDHQLLLWMGVNSFRTSHYPYAEETLQLADRQGFMVISECAAVSLKLFSPQLLANHQQALRELVARDRNHPSVVIWSVANEPLSYKEEAFSYFASIRAMMKELDGERPITAVHYDYPDQDYTTDQVAPHMDIVGVNKYSAWYTDPGHTELVRRQVAASLRRWRAAHGKPVFVAEYGAGTLAGLHSLPGSQFTEDFQSDFMQQYFAAFDEVAEEGWLVGEMPWVFADFMTKQEPRRVNGNRKGLFTRERQPKAAAHQLRSRYTDL